MSLWAHGSWVPSAVVGRSGDGQADLDDSHCMQSLRPCALAGFYPVIVFATRLLPSLEALHALELPVKSGTA